MEQNLPSQNVSLKVYYFELKRIKTQKIQKKSFDFPPNCLKNLYRGPIIGTEISVETWAKNTG